VAVWGALVENDSRGHRLQVFRSLAANRALLRVLQAYVLFILTEYSVWIAMLVFAYDHGGAAIAGLVAVAQLVPASVAAPLVAPLSFAFGAGAVLAATGSALLVGRRLGGPILVAALMFSGTLAALASGLGLAGTVVLLVAAGASRSLLEVAVRILLQRSVPPRLVGRVFGVLEGFMMAGYALGALLVNWMPCRTGISCAGADAATEWARSRCCAPSRAPRQ
jgi:hypothetical protein